MVSKYYEQSECDICIMNRSAKDIAFHNQGGCNYCSDLFDKIAASGINDHEARDKKLNSLVVKIKKAGRRKKYDCIIGVSGGVDSSWVLVKAIEMGLKPLAVHMDNGWNSELAQNNIANLVNGLGVDLYTHVIEWSEYKGLMQAFFDADVLDVELLYDNAMLAVNYSQAKKYGVKYILSGDNTATEGMRMPPGWNWLKFDKRNIKDIGSKNGIFLRTFPAVGTLEYFLYEFIFGVDWVPFLDLFDFNKFEALNTLEADFGYKKYPYKHYESIFTRFYQGFILPRKFNVDKRRMHLSTLIVSGQLSREEAIRQISDIPYPSSDDLEKDIQYFLKKMNWSKSDLENYISREEVPHNRYKSEKRLWDFAKLAHQKLYGLNK